MELMNTGATAGYMSGQARVGDSVGIMVMKKAMSIQASQASQLIESVPDAPKMEQTESHLGQNVNVRA